MLAPRSAIAGSDMVRPSQECTARCIKFTTAAAISIVGGVYGLHTSSACSVKCEGWSSLRRLWRGQCIMYVYAGGAWRGAAATADNMVGEAGRHSW